MDDPMLLPRMALTLLAALLLLGVMGTRAPGQEAIVLAGGAEVHESPDPSAQSVGRLPAGARVRVLQTPGRGWIAIAPPPGTFDWIDLADIETTDDGQAWVTREGAPTRFGRAGAKLPGPVGVTLRKGTPLRLVERPALVLPQSVGHRTWIAIEPPPWEGRYIRSGLVKLPLPGTARRPAPGRDERTIRAGAPGDALEANDPTGDLSLADAFHRASISDPLTSWDLKPVLRRYRELRDQATNPQMRETLDRRIAEVEAEMGAGNAAREFEALVAESRRRDAEVESVRKILESVRIEPDRRFKAKGLLQPSSMRVEGTKVPALINTEGKLLAYLQVPVGLDLPPLYGKKVGVNGRVRYDENLKARLIVVQDIESLDGDR